MANPSSPSGLAQIVRMQGLEWGDGASHDYHLWWDGNNLWCDGQLVVGVLTTGKGQTGTNNPGASLTINPGDSDGSAVGAALTIRAGKGGATGSRGGTLTMAGGNPTAGSNGDGGRVILTVGIPDGSGVKPLIEIDATGGVPTNTILATNFLGFKYNNAGTLVAYVNDNGTIKSLALGTPS